MAEIILSDEQREVFMRDPLLHLALGNITLSHFDDEGLEEELQRSLSSEYSEAYGHEASN